MAGNTYRILTAGEQTGGDYAVIDMLVPPGAGRRPQAAVQESFFVVEGEVVFRSETQTYTAHQGAFVEIPKGGAIHSFTNPARLPHEVARLFWSSVLLGTLSS